MHAPALPALTLGDLSTTSVTTTIPGGDVSTLNNTDSFTSTISGSYDPNDKAERHGGTIEIDDFSPTEYLTYTIRFENTGNGNAQNIEITDALDAQLSETSVRVLASSHPNFIMERTGSNLRWKFPNINLLPSTDNATTTGKGFIVFQVLPKAGYEVGDIISNTAQIYFDTNPAIVTNTVTTEFIKTLGTTPVNNPGFIAYPNPVQDVLIFLMRLRLQK